jgi:hypothetical protein
VSFQESSNSGEPGIGCSIVSCDALMETSGDADIIPNRVDSGFDVFGLDVQNPSVGGIVTEVKFHCLNVSSFLDYTHLTSFVTGDSDEPFLVE